MHLIAIVRLETLHSLLSRDIVPLRKRGNCGVMQDYELRTPYAEFYGLDIIGEILSFEARSNNSFPLRHEVHPSRFERNIPCDFEDSILLFRKVKHNGRLQKSNPARRSLLLRPPELAPLCPA